MHGENDFEKFETPTRQWVASKWERLVVFYPRLAAIAKFLIASNCSNSAIESLFSTIEKDFGQDRKHLCMENFNSLWISRKIK